jgi:hypothetical protein
MRKARADDVADDFLAHLAAIALTDDFRRHFAGPKPLELRGLAKSLEPLIDLAIDLGRRNANGDLPFESLRRLD